MPLAGPDIEPDILLRWGIEILPQEQAVIRQDPQSGSGGIMG